ncbi:hypothetical protein KEM54_003517 [Ascosphaera aggregata]|nr:hypothetical protein KEM54_003517 [Ascosphaera aggregata]
MLQKERLKRLTAIAGMLLKTGEVMPLGLLSMNLDESWKEFLSTEISVYYLKELPPKAGFEPPDQY